MKQLKSHVRHDDPEIMSISHVHVLHLSSANSLIVSLTFPSWCLSSLVRNLVPTSKVPGKFVGLLALITIPISLYTTSCRLCVLPASSRSRCFQAPVWGSQRYCGPKAQMEKTHTAQIRFFAPQLSRIWVGGSCMELALEVKFCGGWLEREFGARV